MSHINVSLFLVCVDEVQVLPHHQNFSWLCPWNSFTMSFNTCTLAVLVEFKIRHYIFLTTTVKIPCKFACRIILTYVWQEISKIKHTYVFSSYKNDFVKADHIWVRRPRDKGPNNLWNYIHFSTHIHFLSCQTSMPLTLWGMLTISLSIIPGMKWSYIVPLISIVNQQLYLYALECFHCQSQELKPVAEIVMRLYWLLHDLSVSAKWSVTYLRQGAILSVSVIITEL